jgi:hypothetical protein
MGSGLIASRSSFQKPYRAAVPSEPRILHSQQSTGNGVRRDLGAVITFYAIDYLGTSEPAIAGCGNDRDYHAPGNRKRFGSGRVDSGDLGLKDGAGSLGASHRLLHML